MAELKETGVALIAKDSAKFQSDMAKNQKAIGGFGDTGTKAAIAMVGLQAGMQIISQVGRQAKQVFDQTVGALIDYNKSILDASRATGTTADDFSRIVQIADDFGISMGTVQTALQLATKNGFAPSVESIAQLADRLNAMESPTERAAAAAKIFGRNWAALDPLLQQGGDAIRAQSAAVRDGLVVTEQEIQKTEKLRRGLDSLGDSWTSLKNTITLEALPALNQGSLFLNFLADTALDIAEGRGLSGVRDRLDEIKASLAEEPDLSGITAIPGELDGVIAQIPHPPSIWDTVFPDPAELAGKIAEQAAFIKAGGPQIVGAIQEIQAGLAQGILTPEQALPMLDDLQEAALSIAVKAGDTTAWDAAKTNADDFGGSISQAKSDIADAATTVSKIPREITIRIRFLAPHLPGAGFQHGGEFTVGGRSGPDANLVAFRATRGERVIVQPQNSSVVNNQRYDNRSVNAQFQGGGRFGSDSFELDRVLRSWFSSG